MPAASDLRSGSAAGETLELWPDLARPATPRDGAAAAQGVGARLRTRAVRRGGGGYLNGCTPSELRQDPRLRELAEIGLSSTWLGVAHLLGYDQFVAMWRLLSSNAALRDDDNQIALRLRPFRAYERYQRNRYIATLVQAGIKPSQIHEMVRQDLGEKLGLRHIKRLAAAGKARHPAAGGGDLDGT